MYLHNDKDLFTEVITEANAQTGIAESIIEKDYYDLKTVGKEQS